jgi:hypothetical protein
MLGQKKREARNINWNIFQEGKGKEKKKEPIMVQPWNLAGEAGKTHEIFN